MIAMVAALAATLALLGGAVWSGITRRRDLHYRLIALTFLCLGVAIWRAEVYGRGLRFEGAALTVHRVHMAAVVLTFLVLPFVVTSGVKLARARGQAADAERPGHKRQAVRFVTLLLITAVLGTLMTLLASPA